MQLGLLYGLQLVVHKAVKAALHLHQGRGEGHAEKGMCVLGGHDMLGESHEDI